MLEAPVSTERPRYNILGFHGAGQRTLYFHGHYDVVPAQCREQFNPVARNGRLYGRGATDMKSGLAAMIYAAYLLKEQQVPLRGRLGLCLVLQRKRDLDRVLAALTAPPLRPGLEELKHWRPDGSLPESIERIVGRPSQLRNELETLCRRQARPDEISRSGEPSRTGAARLAAPTSCLPDAPS